MKKRTAIIIIVSMVIGFIGGLFVDVRSSADHHTSQKPSVQTSSPSPEKGKHNPVSPSPTNSSQAPETCKMDIIQPKESNGKEAVRALVGGWSWGMIDKTEMDKVLNGGFNPAGVSTEFKWELIHHEQALKDKLQSSLTGHCGKVAEVDLNYLEQINDYNVPSNLDELMIDWIRAHNKALAG